jgi:hypothetical protein
MSWRGLLVSVRDAEEAAAALFGGAAIIDVKEPDRGSLGAACPATIAAVADVVGRRVPWTMACGELCATDGPDHAAVPDGAARIGSLLGGVWTALSPAAPLPAAVKVGLAGAAGRDWRPALAAIYGGLPATVVGAAVAYADWRRAAAPPPDEVIAAASGLGCRVLLLDTFDKGGGGLFAQAATATLAQWVADAHGAGLEVAVAGRLALAEISKAWGLGPEVVALRSAVCSNGRTSAVKADLVRAAVGRGGTPGAADGADQRVPGVAGVMA